MKKVLLLFLLIPFISYIMYAQDNRDVIYVETVKNTNSLVTRSVVPNIEATLDYDMKAIEFVFNEQLGEIKISISTMGQAVAVCECNTDFEGVLWVSIPMTSGDYDIYISGDNYEGEGNYIISE